MRKLRITALILVCLGLLVVGVGIGMCFVEASSFTYRDTTRLNMTQEDTATLPISLEDGQRLLSYGVIGDFVLKENLSVQLLEDKEVPAGTLQVEVDYRSVPGCDMDLYWFDYGEGGIHVNIAPNVRAEALMNAKDQLLSDIKNRRIGEYQFAEITGVTFTVNPADQDKIEPLFG